MKKLFLIVITILAVNSTIAQDTIVFPPHKHGKFAFENSPGNPRFNNYTNYHLPGYELGTWMLMWPRVVPQGQSQYIYGVSFAVSSSRTIPDTMTICPIVVTKEGTSHLNVHRMDTFNCLYLRHYDDGSRLRLHLHPPCDATLRDSLVTLYKAYLNTPLLVQDTFYIGAYYLCYTYELKPVLRWKCLHHIACLYDDCPSVPLPYPGRDSVLDKALLIIEDFIDSTVSIVGDVGQDNRTPLIFPILTPPDTHLFSCPSVELTYAGINAGSPTLVWDTAFEHNLYQIAYGPYNLPVDSLRTDTTSNHYYEIFDPSLSTSVYYQARVRSYCHHICHFHDTATWTPWSNPVYFYTGPTMPDTSHHGGQPEGIAPAAPGPAFTLAPNPSPQGRVPTVAVEPSLLAATPLLTLRDLAGRELLRTTLRQHVTPLPHDLTAGTYLLTLTTTEGSTTCRLVVE